MNRDEILSKSREENKYFDEMMIDTIIKSGKASSEIGLIITALIFAIEAFFFNSFNYAIIGVYLAMEATRYLFKYSKMKERKELFFGIISGIVGFLVIVGHFFVSFK